MSNSDTLTSTIRRMAEGRSPLAVLTELVRRRRFPSSVTAARAVAEALGLDADQEAQLLCDYDEGRA